MIYCLIYYFRKKVLKYIDIKKIEYKIKKTVEIGLSPSGKAPVFDTGIRWFGHVASAKWTAKNEPVRTK